jgi:hypothetical protein
MGIALNFWPAGRQAYPHPMTQEELQNWILCAGLYWSETDDHAWLESHRNTLNDCLASMQARDDLDPRHRDGIASLITAEAVGTDAKSKGEITTYDLLDPPCASPPTTSTWG